MQDSPSLCRDLRQPVRGKQTQTPGSSRGGKTQGHLFSEGPLLSPLDAIGLFAIQGKPMMERPRSVRGGPSHDVLGSTPVRWARKQDWVEGEVGYRSAGLMKPWLTWQRVPEQSTVRCPMPDQDGGAFVLPSQSFSATQHKSLPAIGVQANPLPSSEATGLQTPMHTS